MNVLEYLGISGYTIPDTTMGKWTLHPFVRQVDDLHVPTHVLSRDGQSCKSPLTLSYRNEGWWCKELQRSARASLSDIDAATCCAVGHPGEHHVSKAYKILASLKNTMSDRHFVEKNFIELLPSF